MNLNCSVFYDKSVYKIEQKKINTNINSVILSFTTASLSVYSVFTFKVK